MSDEVDGHGFPSTFTPALVAQCVESELPPILFHDMAALQPRLPRYVRVHPSHRWRLCDAGRAAMQTACVTQADVAALPVAALHGDECQDDVSQDAVALRYGVACALAMSAQDVMPVMWLPCDAFALPRGVALRRLAAVRQGALIAMDAASMAAVLALRPRPGDRVLDLCCAPGMKLCLIADAVARSNYDDKDDDSRARGLVVGVDASLDRLYVTRALVQQHQGNGSPVAHVCLFLGDGRVFSYDDAVTSCTTSGADDMPCNPVTPITATTCEKRPVIHPKEGLTTAERRGLRRRHRSGKPVTMDAETDWPSPVRVVYAPAAARAALCRGAARASFDRVLVDVECTHDGSLAHMPWPTCKADAPIDEARSGSTALQADRGTDKQRGMSNAHRMRRMHLTRGSTAGAPPAASDTATPCQATPLTQLQRELLCNGYAQLRPGGTLVYATCAFSYDQNEAIVRDFVHFINAMEDSDSQQRRAASDGGLLQDTCRTRAVLVPPFSYNCDAADMTSLAPCMAYDTNSRFACKRSASPLQTILEETNDAYGIVTAGAARSVTSACEDCHVVVPAGRLWPHALRTSFLFIAKIVKQRVD